MKFIFHQQHVHVSPKNVQKNYKIHTIQIEVVTPIWMCVFEVIVIVIDFGYFNLISCHFDEVHRDDDKHICLFRCGKGFGQIGTKFLFFFRGILTLKSKHEMMRFLHSPSKVVGFRSLMVHGCVKCSMVGSKKL